MNSQSPAMRLMILAGIGAWLAVGVPLWIAVAEDPGLFASARILMFLASHAVFGVAFLRRPHLRSPTAVRIAVTVQCLTAVLAVAAIPFPLQAAPLSPILFVVVAGALPPVRPAGAAIWVAVVTAFLVLVYCEVEVGFAIAAGIAGSFAAFQGFAYATAYAAEREKRAREELACALVDLTSAQALLAEETRFEERIRIAGELHDALGHHLVALGLQLEAAFHQPADASKESVGRARALARDMLEDVRVAVRALRAGVARDLEESLRALAERIPTPAVHLEFAPGARPGDREVAHAILRAAQEFVTNAIKHSGASDLWIALRREGDCIVLSARDNGFGRAGNGAGGSGLGGIAERAALLGGGLCIIEPATHGGFEVELRIPDARNGCETPA